MYSQANVREESVLRPLTRALPSVIVDTEKVLREADGPEDNGVVAQKIGCPLSANSSNISSAI